MKVPLPKNIESQQDLGHTLIIKRTDGIIEVHCAHLVNYTVKQVKENHVWIEKFAEGKKALVLTVAGISTHVKPAARNYVGKGPHKHFVAAEAFLFNSFAQRILANLYIAVNKPKVPANFFSFKEKKEAEKWLREQEDASNKI